MGNFFKKNSTYILLFLIVLLGGFLRFYKIDVNPPGLYIDEASIGYNAYKILTTGHDEHGKMLPVFFEAFGEYKFPVYIYAVVVSMDLFGKTEFAIRFPSAFFGTITIVILFLLTKKTIQFSLKNDQKITRYGPLVAALLLSLSPWHIQFSRAGFEANLALFFLLSGIYIITIYIDDSKRPLLLFMGLFILGLSMYTYQAYRVITPLIILFYSVILYRNNKKNRNVLYLSLLFLLFFCIPLLQFILSPSGVIRFSQTSAFKNIHMGSISVLPEYIGIFCKNYISFYASQFLFISGDGIGRHQIPNFALVPLWQIVFIIVGFYSLWVSAMAKKNIFFLLFFISTIPGALTTPSPHALRSLPLVIPLIIFASYGILFLYFNKVKLIQIVCILFLIFAVYENMSYVHSYYSHYPQTNELDWGAEYKLMIQKISKYQNKYKYLLVDSNIGTSAIYFSFYNESLHPMFTDKIWQNNGLNDKEILFVGSSEKVSNIKLLDTIYLNNKNRDVFAQIWIRK